MAANRKNRKMFMIFGGRFPSDKAASLFAGKSAESFASGGLEVILLVPRLLGRGTENPYRYYSLKNNFQTVFLPVFDIGTVKVFRNVRFLMSFFSFSISVFLYLLMRASREDVIYSNESLPLFFASFAFPNTFYEMHDFPESKLWFFGVFLRRMKWVLIHNKWKTTRALELFGLNKGKIITEPNAVDATAFDIPVSKDEARRKLNLPIDKKIAVYTGHLYEWKGAVTLAGAAKLLPENYLVVFVGGTGEDLERFKKSYGGEARIKIVGFREHGEIPLWQKAADALILPNTAKENISKYYTSPMKLFEYMASKRPVIASDVPSITEIVDKDTALLVSPDSPGALAASIEKICVDGAMGEKLAAMAYERVKGHTWDKRAERAVSFMV